MAQVTINPQHQALANHLIGLCRNNNVPLSEHSVLLLALAAEA
jgi:hypothetical protein